MEFSRVVARLCSTGGATFASVYQLVGYSWSGKKRKIWLVVT